MESRNIVFTKPCTAELIPSPVREPGCGEVLVKLAFSTISSGTERANLIGDPNVNGASTDTTVRFPRQLGYSSSGTIVKLGEGVNDYKVGDRVALFWSTHSEYNCIKTDRIIKLDDDTGFNEAALWHIGTFPMAAIRKCRLELGESAIVMGLGVLGLMAVVMLKAAGAAPIIAVDPIPEKRERALALGADFALDPFESDFAETAKRITGDGVKVAIEVTGNGKALDQVLDCMAKFGRVALLGCTRDSNFTIDWYRKVHFPGITLVGAHTNARPEHNSYPGYFTQRDDILIIQKLVRLGRFRLSDMVEEVHSPENAPEVFTRLANEKFFPLVQFDWRLLK